MEMIVAIERRNVAMKRDSVGWWNVDVRVPGKRMKRVERRLVMRRKRRREGRNTQRSIVFRPGNWWVVKKMRRAMPPVLMLRVYHAQVKWWRRERREMGVG